jgi:nucleoside-diphosphate-sugar epimerase
MKILVTGATGFIGRALCIEAARRGLGVRAANRFFSSSSENDDCVAVGYIDGNTNWSDALKGCDVVVHLAARAHVINDNSHDPLMEFRKVNVEGTLNLARQAISVGLRRFIFISSIGVNGAETDGTPFGVMSEPVPHSDYALSKYEAELGLRKLALETGIEVVVIRPPLVYGLNAPGNFGTLVRWLQRGVPLPLGVVTQNRRSFLGLDNLVDLILTCVRHRKAVNQTFLVSDGVDLSTTEFLQRMGKAMNLPVRLLPVPTRFLAFTAKLFDKRATAQSLMGSLQIDISQTCEVLDWSPPVSVDEGIRRAVEVRG